MLLAYVITPRLSLNDDLMMGRCVLYDRCGMVAPGMHIVYIVFNLYNVAAHVDMHDLVLYGI